MSTRVTLDDGESHHLYLEMFERGKVYLTLCGAEFEARPGVVTVAVPLEIWERLRVIPIDTLSWWDEDEPIDADPSQGPLRSTPEERRDVHRRRRGRSRREDRVA
jgi:hypothetical protein